MDLYIASNYKPHDQNLDCNDIFNVHLLDSAIHKGVRYGFFDISDRLHLDICKNGFNDLKSGCKLIYPLACDDNMLGFYGVTQIYLGKLDCGTNSVTGNKIKTVKHAVLRRKNIDCEKNYGRILISYYAG